MVALLYFCFRKTTWKSKRWEFFISNRLFRGYFQWNTYTYFKKICSWARYSDAKLIKNILNFLVALLRFYFRNQPKILNCEGFLPLIEPLVATFSETRTLTSRKYVAEQGIVMPNWSKIFRVFRSHSSVFALEKQPKIMNFQIFFYLQMILWWLVLMKRVHLLWCQIDQKHFKPFGPNLRFLFEKKPKNLNFQGFFYL